MLECPAATFLRSGAVAGASRCVQVRNASKHHLCPWINRPRQGTGTAPTYSHDLHTRISFLHCIFLIDGSWVGVVLHRIWILCYKAPSSLARGSFGLTKHLASIRHATSMTCGNTNAPKLLRNISFTGICYGAFNTTYSHPATTVDLLSLGQPPHSKCPLPLRTARSVRASIAGGCIPSGTLPVSSGLDESSLGLESKLWHPRITSWMCLHLRAGMPGTRTIRRRVSNSRTDEAFVADKEPLGTAQRVKAATSPRRCSRTMSGRKVMERTQAHGQGSRVLGRCPEAQSLHVGCIFGSL